MNSLSNCGASCKPQTLQPYAYKIDLHVTLTEGYLIKRFFNLFYAAVSDRVSEVHENEPSVAKQYKFKIFHKNVANNADRSCLRSP